MDEQGGKALNIGVSLILTLVIIGVVFTIVSIAIKLTNNATADVSDTTAQMEESKYTKYEGSILKGDQVVALIKEFSGDHIGVQVIISGTATDYIHKLNGVQQAQNKGWLAGTLDATPLDTAQLLVNAQTKSTPGNVYITPTATFVTRIVRDTNTDQIIGFTCTKQ